LWLQHKQLECHQECNDFQRFLETADATIAKQEMLCQPQVDLERMHLPPSPKKARVLEDEHNIDNGLLCTKLPCVGNPLENWLITLSNLIVAEHQSREQSAAYCKHTLSIPSVPDYAMQRIRRIDLLILGCRHAAVLVF
jgi:hypothetical protein